MSVHLTTRDHETVARFLAELTLGTNDAEPPTVADPPPALALGEDCGSPTPAEWARICDRVADLVHARRAPHRAVVPSNLAPTPQAATAHAADRRVVAYTAEDLGVAGVWGLGLDPEAARDFAARVLDQLPTLGGVWTWEQVITHLAPLTSQTPADPRFTITDTDHDAAALEGLGPLAVSADELARTRTDLEETYRER